MSLKIGDIELDLQGQFGLQTFKNFVLAFRKIELFQILPPNLNCILSI